MSKERGPVSRDVLSVETVGQGKLDGPGMESLEGGRRFRAGRGDEDAGVEFETETKRKRSRLEKLRLLAGLVVAIAVLGVLGIGAIWIQHWLYREQALEEIALIEELPEVAVEEEFDPGSAEDWRGELPIQVAEKFTQAETIEERLAMVRSPERVGGALRAFFEEGPGAVEKVVDLKVLLPVSAEGFSCHRFDATIEGGKNRLLCVLFDDEGGAKVDFECYARYGTESWEDLLSGKVESAAQVRLILVRGTYYNHGFSDDAKWRHFIATTPDVNRSLDLYVERGTERDTGLRRITARGASRVTLGIRSVDGSHQKNQFEVTGLVGPRWVVDRPRSKADQ